MNKRIGPALLQGIFATPLLSVRTAHGRSGVAFLIALFITGLMRAAAPAGLTITGDWDVKVSVLELRIAEATLRVAPPEMITVTADNFDPLPVFKPEAPGWAKGAPLRGVRAQEATTPFLLEPSSLVLRIGLAADATLLRQGEDYEADSDWGTIGHLANSQLKTDQPVYASYRHAQLRLDAVVLTRDGRIVLRQGRSLIAAPVAPGVEAGETHLANIWLPGRVAKLAPDNLFPVSELAYPESPKSSPTVADRLGPKALRKLQTGAPLRILAWGDSVTDGSHLPNPALERWQEQFVVRLRQRFPQANIELVTEAWSGRNTASYLGEPPGSQHNYHEKVLGAKPDLVVSEFVNDSGLNSLQVEDRYAKLLANFKAIGAEWIILTPHYVRPDRMGLNRERNVDDDPRPYVAGLRAFAGKHGIALADTARRYGRLWRQGIPHSTLMVNSINHPDARGMRIFADALMELFP